MFLDLYNAVILFLQENAILVGLVIAITEYLKRMIENQLWYKGWMGTVTAFVLGFLFAFPVTGTADLDILLYIGSAIGLGLMATGLYKTGDTLIQKVFPTNAISGVEHEVYPTN